MATSHQLLRHVLLPNGLGLRYAARLLQRLAERRFVVARPLFPARGRASPVAYQLTARGCAAIGVEPTPKTTRRLPGPELVERAQVSHVILTRHAEGWRQVRSAEAYRELRAWALQAYAGRALGSLDKSMRELIAQSEPQLPMRHQLLVRPAAGGAGETDVRIVLLAGLEGNLRRDLRRLPDLTGFPPVTFEIIASTRARLEEAERALVRFARRGRVRYQTISAPPFWQERHVQHWPREAIEALRAGGIGLPADPSAESAA